MNYFNDITSCIANLRYVDVFKCVEVILSLIWDQGSELAQHRKVASRLGLEVYFCDSH